MNRVPASALWSFRNVPGQRRSCRKPIFLERSRRFSCYHVIFLVGDHLFRPGTKIYFKQDDDMLLTEMIHALVLQGMAFVMVLISLQETKKKQKKNRIILRQHKGKLNFCKFTTKVWDLSVSP